MFDHLELRLTQLLILIILSIGILFLTTTPATPAFAVIPTRVPATDLPPPTPVATTIPKLPVATIRLRIQGVVSVPLISVVQWQDAQGNFRDVEGWRGSVTNGQTVWWVEAKDWGSGPFQWVVYAADSHEPIATSKPFQLPSVAGERLEIVLAVTR